jgi:hypothetical protein
MVYILEDYLDDIAEIDNDFTRNLLDNEGGLLALEVQLPVQEAYICRVEELYDSLMEYLKPIAIEPEEDLDILTVEIKNGYLWVDFPPIREEHVEGVQAILRSYLTPDDMETIEWDYRYADGSRL